MDIPALSSIAKTTGLMQQVSLAVSKMILDTTETQGSELVRMMERSVNPSLGTHIDLHV